MSELSDLMDLEFSDTAGWPQLRCRLDPDNLDIAATILAEGIASRRIGVNPRLHKLWRDHRLGLDSDPIGPGDLQILEAGLLQNVGTPDDPGNENHLHGLIAESIWLEVIADTDAGLGSPLRIEGHDWSATDPGGDGLTAYPTDDAGFCFRLWESKHHGANAPVRDTVNGACRQVKSRSLSYLTRFGLIAQQIADDDALAGFYGSLAELWVNHDPATGVGISIGAGSDVDADQCFGNVTSYFDLDLLQHQAQLHLMGDFRELAGRVRREVWKGCGFWTEP